MPRKVQPPKDPRILGARYLCDYWRQEYTVLKMWEDHGIQWLTVKWHPWTEKSHPRANPQWADDPIRVTTHCTKWDRRDILINLP